MVVMDDCSRGDPCHVMNPKAHQPQACLQSLQHQHTRSHVLQLSHHHSACCKIAASALGQRHDVIGACPHACHSTAKISVAHLCRHVIIAHNIWAMWSHQMGCCNAPSCNGITNCQHSCMALSTARIRRTCHGSTSR